MLTYVAHNDLFRSILFTVLVANRHLDVYDGNSISVDLSKLLLCAECKYSMRFFVLRPSVSNFEHSLIFYRIIARIYS